VPTTPQPAQTRLPRLSPTVPLGIVLVLIALSLAAAVACPAGAQGVPRGTTVSGSVRIARFGTPLPDAEVAVTDTALAVRTDLDGRFAISGLAPGSYRLVARSEGYRAQEVAVEVRDGDGEVETSFSLETLASFAGDVVVEPSRYTLYREAPSVRASLSREEVERMPHFADDVFRAARWLPGTTGEDLSSTMNVRGGVADESLILLDGVEIYEGFHLKELFSLTGIIDAEAVDNLEFMSGGYAAQYGNRMSGVVDIRSASPVANRLSFGVSTTNISLLSEGQFAGGRAQWVVAARRTDLEAVIGWVDPDNGLEPDFSDVFGKLAYHLGNDTVLSASVLLARDKAHYVEENGRVEELLDTAVTMRYGWIGVKTAWSPDLYSDTILSAGQTERERSGWIDYSYQAGIVDDRRDFEFLALRQDWSLDLSDRHALTWGFDVRRVKSTYDYTSLGMIRDPVMTGGEVAVTERDYLLFPEGDTYGLFVADRFRLLDRLVVEAGLRWDRQTYIDDDQLSPRLNVLWELDKRTKLRAAWGLFHQAQHINELQVTDGVTTFSTAQQAEHRLLGFDHTWSRDLSLRVELFQKRFTDPMPRWENLLNPIEILPELEADRVLVAPDRARAEGFELALRRDGGRRWGWWASYAYARAEDNIDGEWVPRNWDQRHTVSFDVNFRPNAKWNFNLGGIYHSGWPTTAVLAEWTTGPGGAPAIRVYPGRRNRERLPYYLRIDVRASRDFRLRHGTFSLYLEVMNLLNRENLARPESFWIYANPDGSLAVGHDREAFVSLIPSLGIRWTL
jgi:outer membrane receptor protein involved in Fe transport